MIRPKTTTRDEFASFSGSDKRVSEVAGPHHTGRSSSTSRQEGAARQERLGGVRVCAYARRVHAGTWLGSLRAGFIPPRSRAPIHHAKCTHVCCAVWCVPVACPTHSFGPLKDHPPLACPPGMASFAASSHCHFWSDVSSGSFAGLPRSHPSKQIRRTPTEMRR